MVKDCLLSEFALQASINLIWCLIYKLSHNKLYSSKEGRVTSDATAVILIPASNALILSLDFSFIFSFN